MIMCLHSQSGGLTTDGTYVLVRHFPIRSLSIGHDLPHDNPVAPGITGRGELPEGNGLGGCPADGNLSSLKTEDKVS